MDKDRLENATRRARTRNSKLELQRARPASTESRFVSGASQIGPASQFLVALEKSKFYSSRFRLEVFVDIARSLELSIIGGNVAIRMYLKISSFRNVLESFDALRDEILDFDEKLLFGSSDFFGISVVVGDQQLELVVAHFHRVYFLLDAAFNLLVHFAQRLEIVAAM